MGFPAKVGSSRELSTIFCFELKFKIRYSTVMQSVYIKRPNKKRRNIVVTIVLLVMTIFSLFFFSDGITNTSLRISKPFQAALWSTGDYVFGQTFSILREGDLRKEMDLLLDEKERLTADIVRLRGVREENEILRQALDLEMDKDFDLMMANVSGRDILEDVIVIDRGSNDGIFEGMPVITEKRVIIGRIGKVFDDFSRVILVTHEESAFEVEIQGRNSIGLIEGKGNSGARLTLVPRDREISEGDALVTAALSSIFPQGLFVGLIKEIERSDSDSFQEAEISPFFNVRRLNKVFVITNLK